MAVLRFVVSLVRGGGVLVACTGCGGWRAPLGGVRFGVVRGFSGRWPGGFAVASTGRGWRARRKTRRLGVSWSGAGSAGRAGGDDHGGRGAAAGIVVGGGRELVA